MTPLERISYFGEATLIVAAWWCVVYFTARLLYRHADKFSSKVIDGSLYVLLAMGSVGTQIFKDPETYKYVNCYVVWYLQSISLVLLAGAQATLAFRHNWDKKQP